MSALHASDVETTDTAIVIRRQVSVPRERLFRAWTEAADVAAWWGPEGFSATVEALDLKPGGKWRYVMHGPDGKDYPSEGEFREIDAPRRLVTTDEFGDDLELPGVDLPQGIVLNVLFDGEGDQSQLTIQIEHATAADRQKHADMGVVEGFNSSLDKLEKHLAG